MQDSSSAKEILNLVMSVNGRNMMLQFLMAQHAIIQNPEEKEQIFATAKKLLEEMQQEMKNLSTKIEEGFKEVSRIIKTIRSEMKIYES